MVYIGLMIICGCLYGWSVGSGKLKSDIIIDELKEINRKLDRDG